MAEYLYIIKFGKDDWSPIKIGVSNNPEARKATFQVGCPYELSVLHTYRMQSHKHAIAVEENLHQKFSELRIRGEWFHGCVLNMIDKDRLESMSNSNNK